MSNEKEVLVMGKFPYEKKVLWWKEFPYKKDIFLVEKDYTQKH